MVNGLTAFEIRVRGQTADVRGVACGLAAAPNIIREILIKVRLSVTDATGRTRALQVDGKTHRRLSGSTMDRAPRKFLRACRNGRPPRVLGVLRRLAAHEQLGPQMMAKRWREARFMTTERQTERLRRPPVAAEHTLSASLKARHSRSFQP